MATARGWVSPSVLPGFGMTLGFAGLFLTFIVLIPMAALIMRAASLPLDEFWRIATEPRALASYRLTFGASFLAACVNAVFGFIIAWTLVRYEFPGRRLVDAIIDLPFALPTAVSGIALATVFAPNGWLGMHLESIGIQVAYTWVGVVVALTLIGLPFVVRSVQPALEEVHVVARQARVGRAEEREQVAPLPVEPRIAQQREERLPERRLAEPQPALERVGDAERRERRVERCAPAVGRLGRSVSSWWVLYGLQLI